MNTKQNPLDILIKHFNGNQTHAAKALNMSYRGIRVWVKQGYIPWRKDLSVERVTDGAVKASDVREWAAMARHH